ncbi:MAG TPA: hypothetical protein VFH63_09620 [candidate division Zixibacteria bacterium]|nr:hypothetical protein [candidate division Zixibacteria bacterium]
MTGTRAQRTLVATATAWAAGAMGLAVAAFSLPIDDFWLSLASARAIQEGARPDRAIDLTWTPMLPDALNPQWGAQLILGAPGSTWGALAINGLLIGAGLLLTAVRTRLTASAAATGAAMFLAVAVVAPHLLARAQSFSIALLPLALLLLERAGRAPWLPLAYGALVAVWANLHGAFVIGQAAAVAWLAGSIWEALRHGGWRATAVPAATALAAAVAPILNPVGLDLLAYAYAQPGLEVVRAISVEWQPSWPWIPVATLFWAYLGLVVAGRILRRGGAEPWQLLLAAFLAVLAIGSIRHIPWFVLAAGPMLARDVDALLQARPRLAASVGSVRPTRAAVQLALAALLMVAVQPVRTALPQNVGRVTPDAPVALAERLAHELAGDSLQPARVLNEQVWGGYLDYRLGDQIETAMDGRLEIRSAETWSRYFSLLQGQDHPAERLAAEGVEWVAVRPERSALIGELRRSGWSVVFEDEGSMLLRAQ